MHWPFKIHGIYNRRADIHGLYRGQQQGGIATPSGVPGIFIFTGHGADKHGYADKLLPDGSYRYTGEGQIGDMAMIRGNRAIRDHAIAGKDLLVFEKAGSGAPVRFLGLFACAGWDIEQQLDTAQMERNAIVFTLVPIEALRAEIEDVDGVEEPLIQTLAALRVLALAAAAPDQQEPGSARKNIYRRSRAVRNYVLARANGRCEACAALAPFTTAAGMPYLEPHHIRRLSDGGPDHPSHVAAVCPNCHRRAHHSVDCVPFNIALSSKVEVIEASYINNDLNLGLEKQSHPSHSNKKSG